MAVHEVRIDRSKMLTEEPGTGHNRWHPLTGPVYVQGADAPNMLVSAFLPEDIFTA